jgi:hypothetical protein
VGSKLEYVYTVKDNRNLTIEMGNNLPRGKKLGIGFFLGE